MGSSLEKYKIKVDVASDRETAMYLFNQNIYPVVLIEIDFPDIPGLGFTAKVSAQILIYRNLHVAPFYLKVELAGAAQKSSLKKCRMFNLSISLLSRLTLLSITHESKYNTKYLN